MGAPTRADAPNGCRRKHLKAFDGYAVNGPLGTFAQADGSPGFPLPSDPRRRGGRRSSRVGGGPSAGLVGPATNIWFLWVPIVKIEHMFDEEAIPPSLDEMEPGPFLAAILANTDVDRLSGHDRVVVLRARQRMASHYLAHMYADMAAVADAIEGLEGGEDPELVAEGAAAEIRAALRLTRRAADMELGLALELRQRLPSLWEAFAARDLDVRRVRTMVGSTGHLDRDTARMVVDQVIDRAPQLTTGELKGRLQRLCIEVDPDAATARYEEAVAERRVVADLSDDGTAQLMGMALPPDRVVSASAFINQLARHLKRAGETRTMDQLRADVFLDLLEGRHQHRSTSGGAIELRVDLETLARLSDAPGELAGFGPVIADIARQVTDRQRDGSTWRYVVTDPHTGMPLHHGTTRRRPTATQQRHVETRDPRCVFPGCRMPSQACDLDHRIEWAHSRRTAVDDLAPVCRHDHVIRHRHLWTYRPLAGGDYLWTSRLGHTYTTSGQSP